MKRIFTTTLSFLIVFQLFAYDAVKFMGSGKTTWEKYIAMTIAGIVNRDSARLYLQNVYETWSYNKTDESWAGIYASRGDVTFETISSIDMLIEKFSDQIEGIITYDPNVTYGNFSGQNFMWQGEYAMLIGGLTNRIPIPYTDVQYYDYEVVDSILLIDNFDDDESIYVPGQLNNDKHPWNDTNLSKEERYLKLLNWGVQYLLPRCNPDKFYIREITDFTVQQQMFQVNLAGTSSLDIFSMSEPKADILEAVLQYLHDKNPQRIFHVYGWIHPEPMVQWINAMGASFHETLLGNLSWHSSFPVERHELTPPASVDEDELELEDKYYITFVGTEGDACNWVVGLQSGAWLSYARGSVPVNWGWNLHIFDICPFIAKYYYDTGTENDGFISVTSPLGYAYPDLWEEDVWQGAVDSTKALMDKFNIDDMYAYKHYASTGLWNYRGKEISNSFNFSKLGEFQQEVGADLTMLFDPKLPNQKWTENYGALLYNHVGDNTFYGVSNNVNTLANKVIGMLKKKKSPSFLFAGYQRLRQDDFNYRSDPSDADISIPMLAEAVDLIKSDPEIGEKVEVITIEKFSALMRKKIIVGIDDNINNRTLEDVFCYPNPCSDVLNISSDATYVKNYEVQISDISGKIIHTENIGSQNNGRFDLQISVRNFTEGIYFCTLKNNKGQITKKVIVRR